MAVQPPPQAYAPQPPNAGLVMDFASPAQRLIAYIIDLVIIGFIMGFFYYAGLAIGGFTLDAAGRIDFGSNPGLGLFIMFIGLMVGLLGKPWFGSHGGQTPGYKLLGMRVVRVKDGGPLSFPNAILRLVGYAVSAFIFYIGFIWIIFDAQRQGWDDKIANTFVVKV